MNDVIQGGSHLASDIKHLATNVLKQRLAEQMDLSAKHLVEMASIWTELEHRGEDLSALKGSLTDYLPKIASGELDAQAVVRFAGNRQLLRYLSALHIDQQRGLLDAGSVDVVLPESGETTRRNLAHLSGREVTQVFSQGAIRSLAEQSQLIDDKKAIDRQTARNKTSPKGVNIRFGRLEVDGVPVKVGDKPLHADALLDLLSQYYGVDLSATVGGSTR
jgi:hypothetical protein